jgi:type III restriction enzyme
MLTHQKVWIWVKYCADDKIKKLVVLNDEAHHIHDSALAWFKSIEDISNKLKLKNSKGLSLQADYSANSKTQQW